MAHFAILQQIESFSCAYPHAPLSVFAKGKDAFATEYYRGSNDLSSRGEIADFVVLFVADFYLSVGKSIPIIMVVVDGETAHGRFASVESTEGVVVIFEVDLGEFMNTCYPKQTLVGDDKLADSGNTVVA